MQPPIAPSTPCPAIWPARAPAAPPDRQLIACAGDVATPTPRIIMAAKIVVRMVLLLYSPANGCLRKSIASPLVTRRRTLPPSVSVYSSSSVFAAPCSAEVFEVTGLDTNFPAVLPVLV